MLIETLDLPIRLQTTLLSKRKSIKVEIREETLPSVDKLQVENLAMNTGTLTEVVRINLYISMR